MKYTSLEREMLHALAAADEPLTTAELAPRCPSAVDRTQVSRTAYNLRKVGEIRAVGEKPSHEGRGARPVPAYEITDRGRAEAQRAFRLLADEDPADAAPAPECPVCHGDDLTAPCAYPGEQRPGCLRTQPNPEREDAVASAAAQAAQGWGSKTAEQLQAEIEATSGATAPTGPGGRSCRIGASQ